MGANTVNDLLGVWERGLEQSPVRRALALTAAMRPDASIEELAALPLGARDAELLRLRRVLFGDTMAAVAQCPVCAERLELSLPVDALCAEPCVAAELHERQLQVAGYVIRFRVPTSADLMAIAALSSADAARRALLRRCVLGVEEHGGAAQAESLPEEAQTALSLALAQSDPGALTELALSCPACAHAWRTTFDIASFLWSELNAWAERMLRDVHLLARAYGWREADILGMAAGRRQLYLELARA